MDSDKIIAELNFKAVRSSGAGGQNVNKVSSKVVLSFDLFNSQCLTDDEKKERNSKAVKQAKKQLATPKIKYDGIIYNSLVEAIESTGKSRYLLVKNGELLRKV